MRIKKIPLDKNTRYLYAKFPPLPIENDQMYAEYRQVLDYIITLSLTRVLEESSLKGSPELVNYINTFVDELRKWEASR